MANREEAGRHGPRPTVASSKPCMPDQATLAFVCAMPRQACRPAHASRPACMPAELPPAIPPGGRGTCVSRVSPRSTLAPADAKSSARANSSSCASCSLQGHRRDRWVGRGLQQAWGWQRAAAAAAGSGGRRQRRQWRRRSHTAHAAHLSASSSSVASTSGSWSPASSIALASPGMCLPTQRARYKPPSAV